MKRIFIGLVQLAAILGLVVIGLLAALHWYQPKLHPVVIPAPKPVSGAAVFYNRAFEAIPEMTEAEKKVIIVKDPDLAEAKAVLEKWGAALRLFEQGAALSECEWGLDYTVGPGMKVSMATKTLRACQVLAMRAKLHFLENKASAAVDDYISIFRISRHAGKEPIMICKLAGISGEMNAITPIGRHLQQLDIVSFRRLVGAIDELPPSLPMKEVISSEANQGAAWFNNMLTNAVLDSKRSGQKSPGAKRNSDFQFNIPNQVYTINGGLAAKCMGYWIERYESNRRELERIMALPFPESAAKMDAFSKSINAHRWINGVYSLLLTPSAGAILKDLQMQTVWQILQVALDTQMRDPSALRAELAKLRDPYDGQPVQMRDVEGGVEIQLKSGKDKKPVNLMIALPQK